MRLQARTASRPTRARMAALVATSALLAGLLPAAITGMTYNPFTKSFRLVPDTDVNYMMAFGAN